MPKRCLKHGLRKCPTCQEPYQKPLFFSKLPRHIRDRIYMEAFQTYDGSPIIMRNGGNRVLEKLRLPRSACRQMLDETANYTDFTLKANTLVFETHHMLMLFLQQLEKPEEESKASSVTSVAVHVEEVDSGEGFAKTLTTLQQTCKKLSKLTIAYCTIYQPCYSDAYYHWIPTGLFQVQGFNNTAISFSESPLYHLNVPRTLSLHHVSPRGWANALAIKCQSQSLDEARASMQRLAPFHHTPPKNLSQTSLLLSLPAELRLQIYTYCLQIYPETPTRWILLTARTLTKNSTRHRRPSVLDALQTCHQLYAEAMPLFYRQPLCILHPQSARAFFDSLTPPESPTTTTTTTIPQQPSRLASRRAALRTLILPLDVCGPSGADRSGPRRMALEARVLAAAATCTGLQRLVLLRPAFKILGWGLYPMRREDGLERGGALNAVLRGQRGFREVAFVDWFTHGEWAVRDGVHVHCGLWAHQRESVVVEDGELEEVRKVMVMPAEQQEGEERVEGGVGPSSVALV